MFALFNSSNILYPLFKEPQEHLGHAIGHRASAASLKAFELTTFFFLFFNSEKFIINGTIGKETG